MALALLFALVPAASPSAQKRGKSRTKRRAPATAPAPAARDASRKPTAAQQPSQARPAPASTPAPARAEREDFEAARTFDEVMPAEGYALVFEVRRVGHLVRSKEGRELVELARMLGREVKEMMEALDFFVSNGEQLAEVTAYTAALPAREGLPQFVAAYQFASVPDARAFEPRVRAVLDRYEKSFKGAGERRQGAPAAGGRAAGVRPEADAPKGPSFYVRRYGQLILMTDEPFTLKSLKHKDEQPLAANARFQSLRARLSSEPVFAYIDIGLTGKGAQRVSEVYEKQQAGPTEAEMAEMDRQAQAELERMRAEGKLPPASSPQTETAVSGPVIAPPPPGAMVVEIEPGQEGQEAALSVQTNGGMFMGLLLSGLLSGTPQWPEAIGAALAFDADTIVLRALVVNQPGGVVNPLPFVPMLVSGPQFTQQAASLAPADTEVFISASLDLTQVFNRYVLSIDEMQERAKIATAGGEASVPAEGGMEKMLAAAEKLLGFKIKEDFIPAVGNEFALSVPLKWFTGGTSYNEGRGGASKKEGREPVLLVALNNPEAVRKMLPRLMELAGMKSAAAPEQTETRGGVEIKTYGPVTAAYIGNFLALSWEAASVRRVAEAASAQGTLAGNEQFRAATSWQPRVKLAEAYVSRALIDDLLKDFNTWADPKDPEVQGLLTRLNMRPEPATYAVTGEGGGELLHELRLPTAILKYFTANVVLERKIAPFRQGEGAALMTLSYIRGTQDAYKNGQGKGGYAVLEELQPKPRPKGYRAETGANGEGEGQDEEEGFSYHPLTRQSLERLAYQIKLSAAGDKYTVVATPKEYGKTGRRSFFMDESGVIRAADRNGEPATADDPPVD